MVTFDPPIDEATRVMYEACAAGLSTVGAAHGLPVIRWTPHHDWAPESRRSRIYGRPDVIGGDWAETTAAQQWAQTLGLVELDRDQAYKQLQETYVGVRLWHGIVTGIRVILLVEATDPSTERHSSRVRFCSNAQRRDTRPLPSG